MVNNLLKVRGLKVVFPTEGGFIRAVEGVDIDIARSQCTALVGESGCGKSVTSLAIMKLLPVPAAIVRANEMVFDGQDITSYSNSRMQKIRGSSVSLIFQDPMTSLNPVMTIGKQIFEVFKQHIKMNDAAAKKASIEALRKVGVPAPEKRYHDFPHQLSGGMRQRVLIAMAFACEPDLIIADEPTTALDVTIQAQILDLLMELKRKNNMSLLLITHDLSIVANMADNVYVMYSGKIVEKGSALQIIKNPLHPYSIGLLKSVPRLNETSKRFIQIPDTVPNPMMKPEGCYFHPRCERVMEKCKKYMPVLENIEGERQIRCWNYNQNNGLEI